MALPTNLTNLGIRDAIVLDAEYVARAGEPVIPVCVCAHRRRDGKARLATPTTLIALLREGARMLIAARPHSPNSPEHP
jgi:hypothetical protein